MPVLRQGTILKRGTFVVVSELGRGGFGEVHLARQPKMDRDVAIKVLLPRAAENGDMVARFQREALAAGSLVHENVLPVYDFDFDEDAGVWFLAMQYVPGGDSLSNRLGAPLPLHVTAPLIDAVAGALDRAHERGIIHRDVKPANVLLDGDRPLLTDFGIAHLGNAAGLTAEGTAIGTPEYMSPEQAMGRPVGPMSDQYSLGVMAYQMLGGRLPFIGEPISVALAHVREDPPALSLVNPLVNEEAVEAVRRAMSKKPEERFPTCGDFGCALLAAAGDQSAIISRAAVSAPTEIVEASALGSRAVSAASSELKDPLREPALEPIGLSSQADSLRVEEAGSIAGAARVVVSRAPGRPLPLRTVAIGAATLLAVSGIAVLALRSLSAAGVPADRDQTVNARPPPAIAGVGAPERIAAVPIVGSVRLTSNPEGAAILVDGEPAARTPRLLNLPPGEHVLVVVAPSFRDWERRVQVPEGQQVNVVAELEPLPPVEALELIDRRLGRSPFIDTKGIVRVGSQTDTFLLSEDVNAIVYFRPRTFDVRDLAYTVTYRWQRADGAPPIELSAERLVTRDQDEWYDRGCAPATALDARGTNTPLGVDVLIDGETVGRFTFRIAGGNPANRASSSCDLSGAAAAST